MSPKINFMQLPHNLKGLELARYDNSCVIGSTTSKIKDLMLIFIVVLIFDCMKSVSSI